MKTLTLNEAIAQARHEGKFAGYGPAIDSIRAHCAVHLPRCIEIMQKMLDDLSLTPDEPLYQEMNLIMSKANTVELADK